MTPMTALDTLVPGPLSLAGHRLGTPQQAGALTMVPISGPARPGFVPPRTGLKLTRVVGYGQVELANRADTGVAIVPLHIGYIQDRAQNHALCRSAFLAAGQTVRFDDACCVQQSQGGYLSERDQWFFVLPLELRAAALDLRGVTGYSKLWGDIAALNARHGLPRRGHLEQILSRRRAVLTQFQSRLELQPGQLGALFFVSGRFAGLEIAPDPRYFAEMWTALVCFAYGVAAWHAEPAPPGPGSAPYDGIRHEETRHEETRHGGTPGEADGLAALRAALDRDRSARLTEIGDWLADAPTGPVELREEERYLDLRLSTVTGPRLAGQIVTDGDRTVYASLFAR
ncbi:ARPP-1 family domain-containing protein [Actinomadura coerulea]|uniref:ARPP-1 family domain-containing protein n=1 Tax=Actinomadura coerulea TaxID=46159 RepID=UPI00343E5B39